MPYRVDALDPKKTAMIVVDMQNDFVAEGAALRSPQAAAMVPRLAEMLAFCRERGIHIVYTAHVHRRDGCDMGLYDDLYPPVAERSVLVDGTRARRFLRTRSGAGRARHQKASLQRVLRDRPRPHPARMGHRHRGRLGHHDGKLLPRDSA